MDDNKITDVDEYIEIIKNLNYEAREHGFNNTHIKKLLNRANLFDGNIKLGLVGTGWITKNALYAIKDVPGISPHCIMSRNLTRAELFAEQNNVPHYCDNLFDLIIKGCNVVYIASRTEVHFPQVRNLLFLGMHVICEKPLVVYRYEFNELQNIAKKRGLILFEAWKTRYLPLYKKLRKDFDFANGISEKREDNDNYQVNEINFKFFTKMKAADVGVDKSENKLLRWRKNFCDIYYYPVRMGIALAGQADEASFNIQSVVSDFTTTYAAKFTWFSLYGGIRINISVACLYNDDDNAPKSSNVIVGNYQKVAFTSITNIGAIQVFDMHNNPLKRSVKDVRKQNYRYMIEEFQQFAKLYYEKDLQKSFALLCEVGDTVSMLEKIFSNTFNLFSEKQ